MRRYFSFVVLNTETDQIDIREVWSSSKEEATKRLEDDLKLFSIEGGQEIIMIAYLGSSIKRGRYHLGIE